MNVLLATCPMSIVILLEGNRYSTTRNAAMQTRREDAHMKKRFLEQCGEYGRLGGLGAMTTMMGNERRWLCGSLTVMSGPPPLIGNWSSTPMLVH
jgi:hypothetical protein